MKKLSIMQTVGATLGTVGSILDQVQGLTDISETYVSNWRKERENALRISKTERIAQLADLSDILDETMYEKAKRAGAILDSWDI